LPADTRAPAEPVELDAVDLTDPRTHAETDLEPYWRRLRDERPVFRHRATAGTPGFWVVTRHADIVAVYRDDKRFASTGGNVLSTLLHGGDSASGRMVPVTDGPRHLVMRRSMSQAFAPRALRSVAEHVRAATRRLLATAVAGGGCDFVADVAAHIPLVTICELLGVPEADRERLLRLTSSALASPGPAQSASATWLVRNELLLYFADLVRARRAAGRSDEAGDVVSLLLRDGLLTEDEVVLNCYSMMIGGDETTRLAMSGAVAALAHHPEQWRRLKDGTVTVATAVEEMLRWTTPAGHAGRRASTDVVLHGVDIRAGDVVTVWNVSGNRDEREFARPARLDLGRTPNRHLSFGYGRHFCLGAQLARIELAALLDELRGQVRSIELTRHPRRLYSTFLNGYAELAVAMEPERR
jgi:cytochrome P450